MITGVYVEGLFGAFNHDVDLNLDEGVTILSAPNGYGKSTLLRMLRSVGEGTWAELAQVPFDSLRLCDDQGPAVVFTREAVREDRNRSEREEELQLLLEQEMMDSWADPEQNVSSPYFTRYRLRAHVEGGDGKPTTIGIFSVLSDGQSLPSTELAHIESRMRHASSRSEMEYWRSIRDAARGRVRTVSGKGNRPKELPSWLAERLGNIKVLLIESQRLLVPEPISPGRSRPENPPTTIPAVTAISNDLVRRIRKAKLDYVTRSGEIDRTFPIRFLELTQSGRRRAESASELRSRLRELDDKRAALQAVGILEREELLELDIPDDISEAYVQALSLLVSDIESKLSHFDELERKIALLKELANARFQFKSLEVDADRGLHCISDGHDVPLVQLSSGEQHELVLLYDALFRARAGSLLMIDEPELSLHAAWQSEFISDLKRVLALSGVSVLIATHSSALIADNWDLVVELKGPVGGLHT